MTISALCRQLAAFERMFPQFVDNAIPAVRQGLNFEMNAENLACFLMQWGGWDDAPPIRTIVAVCQGLEDPEAVMGALFTLAAAAQGVDPIERYDVVLPVFMKGIPSSYPVLVIVNAQEGLIIPEHKPTNDAEGVVWLMVVALKNCAHSVAEGGQK